jgi:peptidoglycan/xylan/chitin deacetylase (PgdA/CDA1 family)
MNLAFDLPILMYHHIEPDTVPIMPYAVHAGQFAAHLDVIKRAGFQTLNFRELFAAMEGRISIPPKSVIITFDDGYKSFREFAMPALMTRGMTATVFVAAGEIGGENRWDISKGYPRRALMNEQEIRETLAAGMEIGSHGWAHRDLTACSDADQEEEVVRSRDELQKRFGIPIETFCYCYGRYEQRHFGLLKQAGYRGGVAVFCSTSKVTQQPFALWRIYVHGGDTTFRLRMKLTPFYLRLLAWRARRANSKVA